MKLRRRRTLILPAILTCLIGSARCFGLPTHSSRTIAGFRTSFRKWHATPEDDSTPEVSTTASSDGASSMSTSQKRDTVLTTAVVSLTTVSLAAKLGLLPGLPVDSSTSGFAPYTDAMIAHDAGAALLTGVLAAIYTKSITYLASREILEPTVSRKLIHTFAAPLFVFVWPIYTAAPGARFFAATVTLVNMVRLFLAAQGGEEELARAVSRSGDRKEVLGGPFLYVVVITASILLFWRSSLIGIMAISIMAAGDGMADLVGRRFGKNNKWFFSPNKSIAGSVAFVTAGAACAAGLAMWLGYTGCLELPLPVEELIPRMTLISFICAAVELLPVGDDNWTVPLSAAVLSMYLL